MANEKNSAKQELKESLKEIRAYLDKHQEKHDTLLEPVDSAYLLLFNSAKEVKKEESEDAGKKHEEFLTSLVNLAEQIIKVRKDSSDLPDKEELVIPPYELFLPFKAPVMLGEDSILGTADIADLFD